MDHCANRMRCVCVTATVWVSLVMLPAIVWAQATITGTVKDPSGAVLPGVTVEASSPALIERVRSVVTDATGQYRIVDLRPGTYIVTFALPGFSTVRREGIELSGQFTSTIDANLAVGSLAETLTVIAENPVVDVKSTRREQVVNRELLTSIPSARTYQTMVGLAPGVTTSGGQDVGGLNSPATRTFAIHGGPQTEGRVMVDGMNAGGARGGAGVSNYQVDVANAQELAYTLSGGLGEAETGGPTMNVVPRTGGNTFSGSFFSSGANSAMQGSNLTQELRDVGLKDPNAIDQGVGGERRAWRADRSRSPLVLLIGQEPGNASICVGDVLQQERGQSQRVDLRTRPEPARHLRRHLDSGPAAPDVAGHAPQQVQYFLGRAADVPRVQRRWARRWFADCRAGGVGRHMGHRFSTVPPGDLVVANYEPAAGGGRLRALPDEVWTSERGRRSHFRHGSGRRDPGIDLSIGRLAPEPH